MSDLGPEVSMLGLPLNTEQEAEIQHYIHQRQRRGLKPDIEELCAMLRDMLDPPILDEPGNSNETERSCADAESTANLVDNATDEISAREERTALREAEAMKHPSY